MKRLYVFTLAVIIVICMLGCSGPEGALDASDTPTPSPSPTATVDTGIHGVIANFLAMHEMSPRPDPTPVSAANAARGETVAPIDPDTFILGEYASMWELIAELLHLYDGELRLEVEENAIVKEPITKEMWFLDYNGMQISAPPGSSSTALHLAYPGTGAETVGFGGVGFYANEGEIIGGWYFSYEGTNKMHILDEEVDAGSSLLIQLLSGAPPTVAKDMVTQFVTGTGEYQIVEYKNWVFQGRIQSKNGSMDCDVQGYLVPTE